MSHNMARGELLINVHVAKTLNKFIANFPLARPCKFWGEIQKCAFTAAKLCIQSYILYSKCWEWQKLPVKILKIPINQHYIGLVLAGASNKSLLSKWLISCVYPNSKDHWLFVYLNNCHHDGSCCRRVLWTMKCQHWSLVRAVRAAIELTSCSNPHNELATVIWIDWRYIRAVAYLLCGF